MQIRQQDRKTVELENIIAIVEFHANLAITDMIIAITRFSCFSQLLLCDPFLSTFVPRPQRTATGWVGILNTTQCIACIAWHDATHSQVGPHGGTNHMECLGSNVGYVWPRLGSL